MTKTEQVSARGNIVIDYDHILKPKELYETFKRSFGKYFNVYKDKNKFICIKTKYYTFSVYLKNLTYLGNPHPIFKKRIQIPKRLSAFYSISKDNGYVPLLIGVYTYKKNTVYCDFNIDDYIGNKIHNSSAHIYSNDIIAATKDDFYQKIDFNNNRLTVFKSKAIKTFVDDKSDFLKQQVSSTSNEFIDGLPYSSETVLPECIFNHIKLFFEKEKKKWYGKECYKEMIDALYHNRFQAEWPGYYLEFQFETYIERNQLKNIICFKQDKTKNGVDLDLFFPSLDIYGDLKTHDKESNGIPGNDLKTVQTQIINSGHVFYIICEHSTIKDRDCKNVVTKYWNNEKIKNGKKAKPLSYAKKMKNTVVLKKVYILDINSSNNAYLSIFKQGRNSNGKPREPKILIGKREMERFIINEFVL